MQADEVKSHIRVILNNSAKWKSIESINKAATACGMSGEEFIFSVAAGSPPPNGAKHSNWRNEPLDKLARLMIDSGWNGEGMRDPDAMDWVHNQIDDPQMFENLPSNGKVYWESLAARFFIWNRKHNK